MAAGLLEAKQGGCVFLQPLLICEGDKVSWFWFSLGVVGFILIRRWRYKKLDLELRQPLATEDEIKQKIADDPWFKVIEPGAVAAVTTYDAVHALAMIDDRVLKAMDFSSKLDLDTFNKLKDYVNDQFLSGDAASVAGSFARLQGYTAEQLVGAHLVSEGHVVEFPDAPNQEGWDLLVDGHPMQVKCVMDPDIIKEHLDKFPDIPVIVNAEMGHYFADNSHVIVDHDLFHSQVVEHVHSTIEGIDGLQSLPIHVPVATLALNTIREGGRWLDGRIDFYEATSNILKSTVLVGGGGWVGGKVGMAIGGAVGGPFGAAVGGILGAIFGVLFGRSISNALRTLDYEMARERLNERVYEAVKVIKEAINDRINALYSKKARITTSMGVNIFHWIWPSRRYLVFKEIQKRLGEQISELNSRLAWATNAESAYQDHSKWENGLFKPGFEVCNWAAKEGKFYHPRLNKAMRRVAMAAKRFAREAWKLGLIDRLPEEKK
ncbi:MAG: hypothetical protein HPY81_10070 [Firmicutes bacterium]|nr:hypothetical protein [Bacillota bacterium]